MVPEPVAWWPVAPGWFVVGGVALATSSFLAPTRAPCDPEGLGIGEELPSPGDPCSFSTLVADPEFPVSTKKDGPSRRSVPAITRPKDERP